MDDQSFALKVLSNPKLEIDSYSLGMDSSEIDSLEVFFDTYNAKHSIPLFSISSSGVIKKTDDLIYALWSAVESLTAHQFERLSALIAKLLGFDKGYFATQQSHDQGLDFIAYKNDNYITDEKNREYIFGQCKKFRNADVGTREIRELAGSVALFKMNEFSTKGGSYPNFTVRSYTPIHVYFVCSRFFSTFSAELCSKSDIMALDILDIIYLLHKGVKGKVFMWLKPDNSFNKSAFLKEIKGVKITS